MEFAEIDSHKRSSLRECLLGQTSTDRRNSARFLVWSLGWAAVFVVSGLAQKRLQFDGPFVWLVAVLPAAPAIGALSAYLRFLRGADELVRQIHLEGLAYGFAAGVLVIIGIQMPEYPGAPVLQIDHVLLVMCAAWVVGQLLAARRYWR